jgi:hypothetical protein
MSGSIVRETLTARNRRLLLAAFDRGVTVRTHWGNHYTVTSATQAGKLHEVNIWMDSDFNKHEECSCEWAVKRGPVVTFNAGTAQRHTNGVPPCSHILLVRWHRLSAFARAAVLDLDPELAAAYDGRGQLAEVAA